MKAYSAARLAENFNGNHTNIPHYFCDIAFFAQYEVIKFRNHFELDKFQSTIIENGRE